jgi:hypothetical protein
MQDELAHYVPSQLFCFPHFFFALNTCRYSAGEDGLTSSVEERDGENPARTPWRGY